ncbi:DUF2971 domain-containing protein [Ralstonia pseudosolanacearum]|uniref:DUF2971 domain-containing protein n=1 Tax=Ralstonia pseudosolanacearum TaxID=1310165 RepID=UPI000490A8A4|nr:DUF2971 domain-containing protein [Ralstonia pseudosolanacearum]MDO3559787.1 DUF2971 domain-containing protein [Ralstonia pseudosolanacearum]MDO3575679.1 DUF2971 domain-containing protein [Ralstonia pseudosolanacearum]MDO3587214.1 DUF2971 domain-containing protein [Ralstonia pseudosolanacearum]
MRLYYLTACEWAKKTVKEQRFKLSTFDEANDPFELLAVSIKNRQARKIYKNHIYKHWINHLAMLCTSTTWHSPVMWAHYGDKHRGVCLGFDTADHVEVSQVSYRADRLPGLLDSLGQGQIPTQQQVMTALTTKFKDWEYEREWRIFAGGSEREADGNAYLAFQPGLILREIILGARCEASMQGFADLVVDPIKSVEIFKARAAFDSFEIVRQKQVRPLIVKPEQQLRHG